VVLGASVLLPIAAATRAQGEDLSPPMLRGSFDGCESGNQTVPRSRSDVDYKFGAGDKLRITIYGEDDLSGDFQVDTAGYIRLPLIGPVKAAGFTAHELEMSVVHTLDNGYLADARVAIEVTAYRPFYVIGQVGKPGEYPYVSNMTALDAVALAGGFTGKAVESTIYIRHEGQAGEHPAALDDLTRVQPGDVVRVPETAFWQVVDVLSPLTGFGYAAVQAASVP
jgi:protein involved in polysaccharide export with SLBB domain